MNKERLFLIIGIYAVSVWVSDPSYGMSRSVQTVLDYSEYDDSANNSIERLSIDVAKIMRENAPGQVVSVSVQETSYEFYVAKTDAQGDPFLLVKNLEYSEWLKVRWRIIVVNLIESIEHYKRVNYSMFKSGFLKGIIDQYRRTRFEKSISGLKLSSEDTYQQNSKDFINHLKSVRYDETKNEKNLANKFTRRELSRIVKLTKSEFNRELEAFISRLRTYIDENSVQDEWLEMLCKVMDSPRKSWRKEVKRSLAQS